MDESTDRSIQNATCMQWADDQFANAGPFTGSKPEKPSQLSSLPGGVATGVSRKNADSCSSSPVALMQHVATPSDLLFHMSRTS